LISSPAGTCANPQENETTLVIDAALFPPEGDDCDAALLVEAYMRMAALHQLQLYWPAISRVRPGA